MLPTRTALVAALALALCAAGPAFAEHPPMPPPEHELSLAQRIAQDPAKRAELAKLTPAEAETLLYDWRIWARPKQLAPAGDWDQWLVLAGRGFGKTRLAAEFVREKVESGQWRRIAFLGATAGDVRDTMVEGESGILAISPPWGRPHYEPSKRRLTWPNGARATLFSADEPNRLRGPQHDGGWADELAAWRYPEAWDQYQLGLRLGDRPQSVVTTTPRPIPIVKELLADSRTAVTRGSTYENEANLAAAFKRKVLSKYEGTRLGRQELYAEILDDTPGALWTLALIEKHRVRSHPQLIRTVVAVDPSVAADGGGDECGIVVGGTALCSCKGRGHEEVHAFVFDDLSDGLSPSDWGKRIVNAYRTQKADRVVAEVNNGGGLVEVNLRATEGGKNVSYKAVHASKGKRTRAEPVASLYERGMIHHVGGLAKLESELTTWDASSGAPSPNRLDANVWLLTELLLPESEAVTTHTSAPKGFKRFRDQA